MNYFYVTSSNFRSRPRVLSYENEAIRPNALGNFRTLLGASARHPARVQATLGDARKASVNESETTMGLALAKPRTAGSAYDSGRRAAPARQDRHGRGSAAPAALLARVRSESSSTHASCLQQTVGTGAYTDNDLQETARVFTGWSTAALWRR